MTRLDISKPTSDAASVERGGTLRGSPEQTAFQVAVFVYDPFIDELFTLQTGILTYGTQ